jgi:acyl-coenzyme A thioesterase PaaI-like protein
MHGGLVTTLADEVAAWAVIAELGKFGFTTEMRATFKGSVKVGIAVTARSQIVSHTTRYASVLAQILQQDSVRYEGEFTFAMVTESAAVRLLGGPIPDTWKPFLR